MAEFNDKKVEDILTAWKMTLKAKIEAFKTEAIKVAAWEDELRKQQAFMETLESNIRNLESQSEHLPSKLLCIPTHLLFCRQ